MSHYNEDVSHTRERRERERERERERQRETEREFTFAELGRRGMSWVIMFSATLTNSVPRTVDM